MVERLAIMKTDLENFITALQAIPGVVVAVDFPENPSGVTWIDVSKQGFEITIEHRPNQGFGLHLEDDDSFGSGANEVYREIDACVHRLQQLLANPISKEENSHLSLRELREIIGMTQRQLAENLGQQQSAISKLEGRTDILLSSLFSWVHGLGGKLDIRARFRQADLPIWLDSISNVSKEASTAKTQDFEVVRSEDAARNTPSISKSKATSNLESDFFHLALSKLLERENPLKLKNLKTHFRPKNQENTTVLDGLGVSYDALYIIETYTDKSRIPLLYKYEQLNSYKNAHSDDLIKKYGAHEIRLLLIVNEKVTECSAIGDAAVLRFDMDSERFTNFDEIASEFPDWRLTR